MKRIYQYSIGFLGLVACVFAEYVVLNIYHKIKRTRTEMKKIINFVYDYCGWILIILTFIFGGILHNKPVATVFFIGAWVWGMIIVIIRLIRAFINWHKEPIKDEEFNRN